MWVSVLSDRKIESEFFLQDVRVCGGIGLKTLIIKVAISSKVLYHPSKIPKGIAIIDAKIRPPNTLYKVSNVFARSLPFNINFQADSQTVIGPGNIYGLTILNPSVIKYQKIIMQIGKINGMNLFL